MTRSGPLPERSFRRKAGWGASTSSKLLSHSLALTHELLTERAPALLFQMLMMNSAESLKLGHAIQPVVFGEALLMLETVGQTPTPPRSFVRCSNRHRCSSCLTQGHFPPNRHRVCERLAPAPAALSFFLFLSLLFNSLPLNPPFFSFSFCVFSHSFDTPPTTARRLFLILPKYPTLLLGHLIV